MKYHDYLIQIKEPILALNIQYLHQSHADHVASDTNTGYPSCKFHRYCVFHAIGKDCQSLTLNFEVELYKLSCSLPRRHSSPVFIADFEIN